MKAADKEGVFYEIHDYAGIVRRLLIVMIDAIVLGTVFSVLYLAVPRVEPISESFVVGCFVIAFAYLAGLPATPLGTVGYLATGVRLVDLYGRPAALWRSSFRFGFLVFGPLNLLADIIWLGGDPNRQSIRDKFAGTYVVRRKAQPAGTAPISYKTYYMLGYDFVFAEVERQGAEPTVRGHGKPSPRP